MSKEQTPIEIEAKLMFDKMLLENEECTSTEMMVAFAKAKVLEALEREFTEVVIFDSGELTKGTDYFKTEVKPKYNPEN